MSESFILDESIFPMVLEIMGNKDQYTMEHSSHVQRILDDWIPDLIAGEFITENDIAGLWVSAILHDIGKIFIISRVLSSDKGLNRMEFAHIRSHPIRGYHLVTQLGLPEKILMAIKHHHERWDGKTNIKFPAYPGELKGRDIPLYARIVGVADAFDAMISDRKYRKAMSLKKALKIVKDNAGAQFDPALVKSFIPRMEQVYKERGYILMRGEIYSG